MENTENKQVKSGRDKIMERLQSRYPDKNFSDDEVLYGQISDDFDGLDSDLAGYKEREASLIELFTKNPRAAQFLVEMAKGEDPWIAVVKRLGIDGITELINDPEKQEAYAQANAEHAELIAKQKELEEEYNKNIAESQAYRDQLDAKYGEDTVDKALAVIDKMFKDALIGKITPEAFDMALKVVTHDSDVENARTEGTIAGKNAKIEEKLRKKNSGDGIPSMASSSAAPAMRGGGYSIFDAAREAN